MSKQTKKRFISTQQIEQEAAEIKQEKKVRKKVKNKQKLKDLMAFTPKQMQRKFEGYGLKWQMRDFFITYSLAILISIVFSYVFSFELPYIVATFLIGIFFAPIILTSQKKYQYEANRFSDANIYMQQFEQGMLKHARISAALRESLNAFPGGKMRDTIEEAINILSEEDDVRDGEILAFQHIEKRYGNRQMSTLHDFAIKIEDRGGDFSYEINLLDKLRLKWKERVNEYQKDLQATTLFCVFEYAMITMICGFIQGNMPESMSITHDPVTQIAEVIAILIMYLFLLSLQKKKCQNWIEMEEPMPEEEAESALDYVENFNPAVQRRKNFRLAILWAVGSIMIIVGTKDPAIAIACIVFEILILNSHHIIYELTKKQIKDEMRKSFPKWLFDICLLLQKDNVANAITKSIPDTPPILKRDLERLNESLMENPSSTKELLEFLEDYQVPGVRETMSMLVSLNNGNITDDRMQMEKLVNENMNMIDKEDEIAGKLKTAILSKYYYYPMLPCAGLMAVYFVGSIFKIFLEIQNVLGI